MLRKSKQILKIIILSILPLLAASQTFSQEFKVTVILESISPVDKIFLEYFGNKISSEDFTADSIMPISNISTFSGRITEPWKASLIVRYKERYLSGRNKKESYDFFLSPGNIEINAKYSLRKTQINGPKPTLDFSLLKEKKIIYEAREDSLLDKLIDCEMAKNIPCSTRLERELDSLEREMKEKIYISYYVKNLNSPLAIFALNEGLPIHIEDAERFEALIEMLPNTSQLNPRVIKLKSQIIASKNSYLGKEAIDFSLPDINRNLISLSSFRGKYLYVDFWASWCMPCRRQHPALIEIYQKFKKYNFEILGIALEREKDKEKWFEAIRNDNLPWYQVSDLNFWDNKAARLYGIRALPANFLLNPNGVIIAKNLEPTELSKILSELIIISSK